MCGKMLINDNLNNVTMKTIVCFIFLFVSIVSCTDISDDMNIEVMSESKAIVLKERNPNYPWIPSDYKSVLTATRGVTKDYASTSHRRFLGYSFKDDIYPLEDTRNLGYEVIDIDKLYKDNPKYLDAWKNNTGAASSFSYATFDRYVSNSTVTNSVSGGFKLNLGLFSIGNKRNLSSVFSKSMIEDKNTTFGELNIIVRDSCYRLQYSSNIQSKIKEKYLSETFKDELYNTHPSEFFSNYGGFVLTDFVVGGKATAQYAGIYKKTETNETKESKMSNEIEASYGFKYDEDKDGNVSGNLGLGRGNNSGTSITNEFSSIMMSIRTIGGNSSFASFSIPKEVKNTNVDLSAWVSSLNDKSTHNIVEFGNGGLIPITDLIVEVNLKSQINKYYETGVSQIEKLSEPYVIIKIRLWNGQFYIFETNLYTRFGSAIALRHKVIYATENYKSYLKEEAKRVSGMFGLKVINGTPFEFDDMSFEFADEDSRPASQAFNFSVFEEKYLKKFVYGNTIYLVSNLEFKEKKYALSIYKDRYIDEYAMRDLINRLPTIDNMTYEELVKNYNK